MSSFAHLLTQIVTIRRIGVFCITAGLMTQIAIAGSIWQSNDFAALGIVAEEADAVTFNTSSNHIWTYGKQRLQAFHTDGSQLVDRVYPELPAKHSASELLAQGKNIWLVIGRVLYHFDNQGGLLKQQGFREDIKAIHYDVKRSELLVITPEYVFVLDSNGKRIDRIRTRLSNLA